MAFARFADGSDVYVFPIGDGGGTTGYECCACSLETGVRAFRCDEADEMAAHLEDHRRVGHQVPDGTVARIRRWSAELAAG